MINCTHQTVYCCKPKLKFIIAIIIVIIIFINFIGPFYYPEVTLANT